jgi:hypothetical protein
LTFTDLDKIFWMRTGLGVLTGCASELFFGCRLSSYTTGGCVGGVSPDYQSGILMGTVVFLGSYYLARVLWGKKFPKQDIGKLYTTGLGSYVLLFLFTWILLFTLQVNLLTL